MGLGRVELPTSRLSGHLRFRLKSGKLADFLNNPRDQSGGLAAENGRKPVQIDTTIDTMSGCRSLLASGTSAVFSARRS